MKLLLICLLVIGVSASKDKTKDSKNYVHGIMNTDEKDVQGLGDIALMKITRRLGDLNLDPSKKNVADEILQNAEQTLKGCNNDYKIDQNIARYKYCVGTLMGTALRQIGYLERSMYSPISMYPYKLIGENENVLNRVHTSGESDMSDYDVEKAKKVSARKIKMNDLVNLNRDQGLMNSPYDLSDQLSLNSDRGLYNSRLDGRKININDLMDLNRYQGLPNSRIEGRMMNDQLMLSRDHELSNSRLEGRSSYMNDLMRLNRDQGLSNGPNTERSLYKKDRGLTNTRDYLARDPYDVGVSSMRTVIGGDRDIYGRRGLQSVSPIDDWNLDRMGRYQRSINYNDDPLKNLGNVGWYRLVLGIRSGDNDRDSYGRIGGRQNMGDIYGRYATRENLINAADKDIYDRLGTTQDTDSIQNILMIRGQLDNYQGDRDIHGRMGSDQKIRGRINLYNTDDRYSQKYGGERDIYGRNTGTYGDYDERNQKLMNERNLNNNYRILDNLNNVGMDPYNTENMRMTVDSNRYGDNYRQNLYSGMRHGHDRDIENQ